MAKIEDRAATAATLNDDIGEQKRLALYRSQLVIREAEQRAYDLFLQNLVKGTSHLSLGQEAVAAGFAEAMQPGDLSFCTYRGHAHTLARGVAVTKVLGELMQRDIGLMRGKGGSMHLTSVEHGVMGSYAIIGAHLPIACGAAWRAQYMLYATKGEVPDGEIVDTLGTPKIVRPGKDATILALALMVPRALAAAEKLKSEHGIDCELIDVRSLVPLVTRTILSSVARTHRLFTVEENPRLCGRGAELVSIIADEAFYDLDGPPVRITTPHIPLPAADILEDLALPSVDRIAERVQRSLR
jgi:Transketolase, C-terminal domain/Dehydrogenase E1 component